MSEGHDHIRKKIQTHLGPRAAEGRLRVHEDTTDFFRVDYGDVLDIGGRHYMMRNYEREGRFGIDDEPKYWVRRAVDLDDGSTKIIKMVFHENFTSRHGDIIYECARSPIKEARILDLVRGRDDFMQGVSANDSRDNNVRVLEYIKGKKFHDRVLMMGESYEDYYDNHLAAMLDEYITILQAIAFLHEHGETHGDIRRDHIIHDMETGTNRWIDFDYLCIHRESPYGHDLAGLGNILIYVVGRGDVTVYGLKKEGSAVLDRLAPEDMNLVMSHRVANLGKVYPFVSRPLCNAMAHFSAGAEVFYDDIQQLLDDVQEARMAL